MKKRTNTITPSSCNYDVTTHFSKTNSTESYFFDDNLNCCDESADNAINERLESLENEKNEKLEKEQILLSKMEEEKDFFLLSELDKIMSNVSNNYNNNNHYTNNKYVGGYAEIETVQHFSENSYTHDYGRIGIY